MDEQKSLQERVNTTYFQKFNVETLEPEAREQNTIEHMKRYFLNESLKGKSVFDIGCNFGLFSLLSKREGAKYVLGIDMLNEAIGIANELKEKHGLDVDFKNERFKDGHVFYARFDVTICCSVYHYLYRDYRNHDRIWRLLWQMTDSIFFEDALDMTDVSCLEFFNGVIPEEIPNYTPERILSVASWYFDIEKIGMHVNGTRHIYWMKRKKRQTSGYPICERIFQVPGKSTIIKQEEDGIFKAIKTYCFREDLLRETVHIAYKRLYPKIKDVPGMVKVGSVQLTKKSAWIKMEYLEGYVNACMFKAMYRPSMEDRVTILKKVVAILERISVRGVMLMDFGCENFMINRDLDVKLIDLSNLIDTSLYTSETRQVSRETKEPLYPTQETLKRFYNEYKQQWLDWLES